jgi:hypothetical protein
MLSEPLQPIVSPFSMLARLSADLSPGLFLTWALYAVFAFWVVYTLVAVYHWIKYSHASFLALPAIALHLIISFSLMSYALSGKAYFLAPFLP